MTATLEPTTTARPPLRLGALTVDPAVVLAPMAGITNPAFRTLCREFGAGLYVCEMITTRALVERNEKTLRMIRATADEKDAFFDPAGDKPYRHPTFYDVPEGLTHL